MTDKTAIVEKLSQFNNLSFTKKQWDIILKGCGCPKSCHFWAAFKKHCLYKVKTIYVFTSIDQKVFNTVYNEYCKKNSEQVKKCYLRAKARKQIKKRREEFSGLTFYMVGGVLTTEKPERDI